MSTANGGTASSFQSTADLDAMDYTSVRNRQRSCGATVSPSRWRFKRVLSPKCTVRPRHLDLNIIVTIVHLRQISEKQGESGDCSEVAATTHTTVHPSSQETYCVANGPTTEAFQSQGLSRPLLLPCASILYGPPRVLAKADFLPGIS